MDKDIEKKEIYIEKEAKIKLTKEQFYDLLSSLPKNKANKQLNLFLMNRYNEMIRLRIENLKYTLTIKKPIASENLLKYNYENEIEVDDSISKVLEFLEFREVFSYKKDRTNISMNNCIVSFDKFDSNDFYVEIEGDDKNIWIVIKKLGLENLEIEKKSYLEIFGGLKWPA